MRLDMGTDVSDEHFLCPRLALYLLVVMYHKNEQLETARKQCIKVDNVAPKDNMGVSKN